MSILLRDRRMADDYQDIPLQKTTWYTLTVKQLTRDKSLRLAFPVLDEPLTQQMLEGALGSVNNLFVVDQPTATGPKHVGIAGMLYSRPLDTRVQVFASIDGDPNDAVQPLAEVYQKIADVVKDEIGRKEVAVAVIPKSTHEKALTEAGYTAIATVPGAVRIRKTTYDVSWYAL